MPTDEQCMLIYTDSHGQCTLKPIPGLQGAYTYEANRDYQPGDFSFDPIRPCDLKPMTLFQAIALWRHCRDARSVRGSP